MTMHENNNKYTVISNSHDFVSFSNNFLKNKNFILALDMEEELNQHVFGEQLCLLQIFDGNESFIIDPFGIDLAVIKSFLEDRKILKVMYDSSSDFHLLKRKYHIDIKSILDLRPAVDLLNYSRKDLHSVIEIELHIQLTGKDRYQRYNWTTRPISHDALDYAVSDVRYLLSLKEVLIKKLIVNNLLDRFILSNLQVQNKFISDGPEDKYRRISGYYNLGPRQKLVFQKLYDIRNSYAEKFNLPAYRIMRNNDLISISRDPQNLDSAEFSFNSHLIEEFKAVLKSA